MKKEYIKPECYIVKVGLESMLAASDMEVLPPDHEYDDFAREDYTPNRPGSTNIWDQGW